MESTEKQLLNNEHWEQFTDCIRCGVLLPENLICPQCELAHGEEEASGEENA